MNRKTFLAVLAAGLIMLGSAACTEPWFIGDESADEGPPVAGASSGSSSADQDDSAAVGIENPFPDGIDPDQVVTSEDPILPEPDRPVPPDMVKVPAIIESAEIYVAESFPPQYFVHVVAGLLNACVEFYGYETTHDGNQIHVSVTNLEPAPTAEVACAQIYRTHEFGVALGTDFESGETISVTVNDLAVSLIAG